ncbi:Unknown protein [Striga hermonthica]|uniref:Uncharacterized protein n=1 Tax=Striga hermonthica TaxID=68872 RepID=A0A9N7NGH0_STRHE|nr:Unknown protein [Striga hermonthica]
MQFGCLLDLTITMTPDKLGYWLVDKFNHMDCKLQLYGGENIHLNEDNVYLALGLPRGKIEIMNKKKKSESELLKDWVRLYKVSKPTNITATKVLDMIQSCEGCDDRFKRNFIVLIVTRLFESTSNGMANLRMIHLLDDLSSVVKMNWCSYLILCPLGTKKSWNDNRRRKNFTGPLLFLTLFYVDKVVLSIRTVARTFSIFKAWNDDLLKDRERAEILTGAFGRGYVDVDIHVPDPSLRVERKVISPNGDDTKRTSELSVQKLLGVSNEDVKVKTGQHTPSYDEEPATSAPTQLVDDVFWNDPNTLASIDAVIDAVARRDRFKRIHHEGPNYSLGLGLSSDDENVDAGRHNNVDEFNTGGPSNVDVPSADCGTAMNDVAVDTDETGLTENLACDNGHGMVAGDRASEGASVDVIVDNAAVETGRPKRHIMAGSAIKSPFKRREIDAVKELDGKERMVVNWLLKNQNADDGLVCIVPETRKFTVLDSVGACKDNSIKKSVLARVEVVDFDWTEGLDVVDAGVITMRLMETFKGRTTKSWNSDMKKADKGQLELMRNRYCYVIAFASNNDAKDDNLVQARKFMTEGVK